MPTLYLHNESKVNIPLGKKAGTILAGAKRTIENITTSEFEELRIKLDKFKGKLRYWTDIEDHLQGDIEKRMALINEAANRIERLQKKLESKTESTLSTCIRIEEERLITCPKNPISIFKQDIKIPKHGSWFLILESDIVSHNNAEGILSIEAHNFQIKRTVTPGFFFMTALLQTQPEQTKINIVWKSNSGSLRMQQRSLSLLNVNVL